MWLVLRRLFERSVGGLVRTSAGGNGARPILSIGRTSAGGNDNIPPSAVNRKARLSALGLPSRPPSSAGKIVSNRCRGSVVFRF
jgi:hypothetical protein